VVSHPTLNVELFSNCPSGTPEEAKGLEKAEK